MTPDERASAIAAKVARFFVGGKSWSWTTAGVTFTLSGFKLVPRGIEVVVTARDASGPLPTTDSYRFINPPTSVVTGTRQVGTDEGGLPVVERTVQRDEVAAAKQMVEETVLLVARQKGWGG